MEKPPDKKEKGDVAHEVGKAVISAIPAAGGPLSVLFENIFTAPLEKRKQAWLEELADVITKLQERVDGLTPEKLSKDEAFITISLQASQIAIRNHQKEKIDALRAAVLNSALPNAPDEDQELIFLRLIDQLTPWHLRILSNLHNPGQWMEKNQIQNPGWGMGGVSTVLEHCFPDLRGNREFYDQIVRDLQTEGLVGQGNFLHVTMTGNGMLESRTSGMGKMFLSFITEPE